MYTMDLNPQRLATGPINPNFTKTNRNSYGNNLLNEPKFEEVVHRVLGYGVYSISYKKHMICKLESNQYINIHAGK
jgi:hypothetical protein